MSRKWYIVLITFVIVILGIVGVTMAQGIIDTSHGNEVAWGNDEVETGYIVSPESLPDGPDVKAVESVIMQGWTLRHEAGLAKNKGKEEAFKRDLQRYFSDLPKRSPENSTADVDAMMMGEVKLPPEKAGQMPPSDQLSPLQQLGATASELERQRTYIDNGRYFEQMANFVVLDFKVDKVEFKRIRFAGDTAEVIVDIFFRSKYSHTNPDGSQIISQPVGGEQHTFKLARFPDGWKVTDDTFIMVPGYEP